MKNLVLLFITMVVLSFTLPVSAQNFHLGVIGGWNSASFTLKVDQGESQEVKARNLFGVGGVLGVGINQFVFVELQPMYLQKGGTYVQNALSPDFELTSPYFEIPVFLKVVAFREGFQPYIMGGPTFGFLLSSDLEAEVERFNDKVKVKADFKDVTKTFDFGLGFGVGIRFPLASATLFMEGRYVFGLTNLNKGGTVQFKYEGMVVDEAEIDKEDEFSNKGLQVMAGLTFPLGGF